MGGERLHLRDNAYGAAVVKFAIEPLAPIWAEIMVLAEMHWQETEWFREGQVFAPNKETYLAYNKVNLFLMFTAREAGRLVGYAGIYLTPSMHTNSMTASEDTWYMLPEFRVGWNTIHFLRFVLEELQKRCAAEVWFSAKLQNRAGRLLEFVGFRPIATRFVMNLLKGASRHVQPKRTSRA